MSKRHKHHNDIFKQRVKEIQIDLLCIKCGGKIKSKKMYIGFIKKILNIPQTHFLRFIIIV